MPWRREVCGSQFENLFWQKAQVECPMAPLTLSLSPHRMRGEGGFSPVRGITWVTSAWWWCRVGPYGRFAEE